MSIRFQQKTLEPLRAWLLHLWDTGVENIVMSCSEMGSRARLMTHPSLWRWLRDSGASGFSESSHESSLANQGNLPYLPTSWKTYAELQQVLCDLGMKNIFYNMDSRAPMRSCATQNEKSGAAYSSPMSLCVPSDYSRPQHRATQTEATCTLAEMGRSEPGRKYRLQLKGEV